MSIPRPIVIGFTNGIAVLIVSTQIKDFLGLAMAEVSASSFHGCGRSAAAMPTIPQRLRYPPHRWR